MGKFSFYNISLRALSEGAHKFEYKLDNQFFKLINDGDSDLNKGLVNVDIDLKRKSSMFELNFMLKGEVFVPCDRCLDDMPIDIDSTNRLIVKFGKEYAEESEEIVIIPEDDGEINVAWFLFEFIALSVPMKHVHPPGKCNKIMTSKLNKHRTVSASDEDEDSDDDMEDDGQKDSGADNAGSQWDALKDINFDDN